MKTRPILAAAWIISGDLWLIAAIANSGVIPALVGLVCHAVGFLHLIAKPAVFHDER